MNNIGIVVISFKSNAITTTTRYNSAVFIVELILHIIVITFQVDDWLKESGTRDAITFQNGQSGDNLLLYGPC